MATARRPYVRVPLGVIDDALRAGVSAAAALLLAQLITHRAKRSIPGLLCLGPSGLAESLTAATPAGVRRSLMELERHGLILLDAGTRPPLLYVCGSIPSDPPVTANAVRGMAAQRRELPPSTVTDEVVLAIGESLRGSEWLSLWQSETANVSVPGPHHKPRPEPGIEPGIEPGPLRDPIPDPDPDPAAAAAYRRAWNRLPKPPFAAAAVADFVKAAENISTDRYNKLIRQLASSKWVAGPMTIPPTLRRLADDAAYVDRIVAGEFAAIGSQWSCRDCRVAHEPLDDCPLPCRACKVVHPPGHTCARLRDLEAGEAERAELKEWRGPHGETWESLVSQHGNRLAYQRRREIEARATA